MKPGRPDRSLPAPARIRVLLASEASTAVIFRRGPSRWTRLYLWNTKTDEITPGSWFRGRLYEDMSDLSPDGQHLLYFARNEERQRQQVAGEAFGVDHLFAWVALCRPPWVKATGLWSVGAGLTGGGVFRRNHELCLYNTDSRTPVLVAPDGFTYIGPEDLPELSPMLISMRRTGWSGMRPGASPLAPLNLTKHLLTLRQWYTATYRPVREYAWHGPSPAPDLEGASWADIDQQGRLVYARAGRLYTFAEGHEILLADLNLDQPPARREIKDTE